MCGIFKPVELSPTTFSLAGIDFMNTGIPKTAVGSTAEAGSDATAISVVAAAADTGPAAGEETVPVAVAVVVVVGMDGDGGNGHRHGDAEKPKPYDIAGAPRNASMSVNVSAAGVGWRVVQVLLEVEAVALLVGLFIAPPGCGTALLTNRG